MYKDVNRQYERLINLEYNTKTKERGVLQDLSVDEKWEYMRTHLSPSQKKAIEDYRRRK